ADAFRSFGEVPVPLIALRAMKGTGRTAGMMPDEKEKSSAASQMKLPGPRSEVSAARKQKTPLVRWQNWHVPKKKEGQGPPFRHNTRDRRETPSTRVERLRRHLDRVVDVV